MQEPEWQTGGTVEHGAADQGSSHGDYRFNGARGGPHPAVVRDVVREFHPGGGHPPVACVRGALTGSPT